MAWQGAALVLGAYLLGAVPFGLLASRAFGGPDPRAGGSGNIGATNVARQAGKTAGVVTLLLDVAKGFTPTLLAAHLLTPWWAAATGLAAFLGHCWPIYLGFRGGKGVATALGVFLAFSPLAGLSTALLLIIIAWLSKHMSLGSLIGCASAPGWLALLGAPLAAVMAAGVMSLITIYKHRENIVRLRAGQEHGWR
ncbi:MAG: glycerol-3-phosphate 1-O-acyltransferase [Desulfarculus sp.]|jgi:glycerol-3-phosphate acyltransferase PlsY|nr:MAG: glycerol-3-phosphate 1-O-acyltransferase [Desulfarculus sp.]